MAAAIVSAARLSPTTDVLEVGPGLGVMTQRLATQARRVVAVEIDPELARVVQSDVSDANVTVVTGDILKLDPKTYFDDQFVVVANLPYHITSPALRHLLGSGPPYAERMVVTIQFEVAERIAAQPGQMSALAVVLQAQAEVTLVRRVPAQAFYPRPKVDSAVVLLEPRPTARRAISREELQAFTTLVQAGFKQPRKTLVNSLSDGLNTSRQDTTDRLSRAHIDPTVRPQALSAADWVRLFTTP